jgi:hypothetical protein
MGVCSMKEVANGHANNEASRLAASLAQARRRSEPAERDRRLEKLAVEVITTRISDLVSPKHIDAREVAKLERKSEPPMFTSPDPRRFVNMYGAGARRPALSPELGDGASPRRAQR